MAELEAGAKALLKEVKALPAAIKEQGGRPHLSRLPVCSRMQYHLALHPWAALSSSNSAVRNWQWLCPLFSLSCFLLSKLIPQKTSCRRGPFCYALYCAVPHSPAVPPALLAPADCFKGLDLLVKNYMAAVPLIGDLRSPAMRPRHWEALQQATKVGGRRAGTDTAVVCSCVWMLLCLCCCSRHAWPASSGCPCFEPCLTTAQCSSTRPARLPPSPTTIFLRFPRRSTL